MTREQVLALCNKAHDVGSVKPTDFVNYVVVLESRRRVNDEWHATRIEHAYLAVDGTLRVAMANEDHRKQGKRLDFGEPKVLIDDPGQLTLQVTVTSEIYGTRHGIATGRKKSGMPAEKHFSWEVAETSAIGRALAATLALPARAGVGYGLFPGAGLASAEDMMRVQPTDGQPNANGNGGGVRFCPIPQAALKPHGKGWAHRLKSGAWCYGTNNHPHRQCV